MDSSSPGTRPEVHPNPASAFSFTAFHIHQNYSPDTVSVLANLNLDNANATKMLASAASKQVEEVDFVGVGTVFVFVLLLGSTLLEQAQRVLALGVNKEEILQGYNQAMCAALSDEEKHASIFHAE